MAVAKAKATQNVVSTNALIRKLTSYHLANGDWPVSMEDLGAEFPEDCYIWSCAANSCMASCGAEYRIKIEANGTVTQRYCMANKEEASQNRVCKALTGVSNPRSSENGKAYLYGLPFKLLS